VIGMGRNLKQRLSPGRETNEQFAFLRLGSDEGQGHLFSNLAAEGRSRLLVSG
jgi:hypothetical protein